MTRSTSDIGLDALVAACAGAGTGLFAAVGALVVGAAALGAAFYKILTDDEADVLADALELVATDKDPTIARERMRWIARADGTPLREVIERIDWSQDIWDLTHALVEPLTHRERVRVAIASARSVLPLVRAGEQRPRIAIETAERWLRGDATREELHGAAADSAYAAYAATASADAAAYAAAAYAAAYAAYAVSAADADAAYAAYAVSAADAAYAIDATDEDIRKQVLSASIAAWWEERGNG